MKYFEKQYKIMKILYEIEVYNFKIKKKPRKLLS